MSAARFVLRILAIVASLLVASRALGADEGAPVQKPQVKVGDHWKYRVMVYQTNVPVSVTIDNRVVLVENDLILNVDTVNSGKEFESQFTSEWASMSGGILGEVFDPPIRHYRFPLTVGATYPYEYAMIAKRGSAIRTKSDGMVTVVGWEDVQVPAGKFRALKIEAKGTYLRRDIRYGGYQRWTYWYVPEVKRWVKGTYEDGSRALPDTKRESELLEFNVR
jgi:hypothetical protein